MGLIIKQEKAIANNLELSVKLSSHFKLSKRFKMNVSELVQKLHTFTVEEIVDVLYCGASDNVTKDQFIKILDDSAYSIQDLYQLTTDFISGLLEPTLSVEERREKYKVKDEDTKEETKQEKKS